MKGFNAYEAAEDGKAERTRHSALTNAVEILANELEVSPSKLVGVLAEALHDRYYVHRCNALDRLTQVAEDLIRNRADDLVIYRRAVTSPSDAPGAWVSDPSHA